MRATDEQLAMRLNAAITALFLLLTDNQLPALEREAAADVLTVLLEYRRTHQLQHLEHQP